MAQIANKHNAFEIKIKNHKRRMAIWGAIIIFNFFVFLFTASIIPFPLYLFFGFMIIRNFQSYRKLKSRLVAECTAVDVLEHLGSDYTVINDLVIEFDGKTSQIYNVMVGSKGVFVVDTNNIKGYIVGNENEHDITTDKVGRQVGEYSNALYNPIKQVETHVFILSNILKQHGFTPWVQGMVFFSNPKPEVNIQSSRILVFSYANGAISQINTYIPKRNRQPISKEVQSEIIKILINYTKK